MANKFWQFKNLSGGSAELMLYGEISDSTWWGDEVTPKQFAEDLRALGDVSRITVRINSSGGDVFAAQAIGNLLEQHSAETVAHIDGLCASAATIIACHCNKTEAAEDSTYMIHPVKMGICGYVDAASMQKYIEALETITENIVTLYCRKTGKSKDDVTALMDATSWWTGTQAKDNGFVDEIITPQNANVVENRSGILFVNGIDMKMPFDKAPTFVQNSLTAAPAAKSCVDKTGTEKPEIKNKEVTNMEPKTVDELRAAFPDLVNQVEQAATNVERQRIRDIEEMTLTGSEDFANEAKFTKPMSASDYAIAVAKNAKNKGNSYLEAVKEDAKNSGISGVEANAGASGEEVFLNAIRDVRKEK